MKVMSPDPAFSVLDDCLDMSTCSSEYSFEYSDSVEITSNNAPSNKRSKHSLRDDLEPRQRRKLNEYQSMTDQNPRLACPFAKYDPLRYRQCFKYDRMDQISRLKQHLLRVHQVPIHCVRCSQTFSTEDERDSHLRSIPGCPVQPNQMRLGITETQKAHLAQRVSSKRSKEDNWYLIYEILFPGCSRPGTPYLDGTQFAEELFAVREYAVREAPARIAKLTSALQQDDRFPLAPPESKHCIEAFAFTAVKDVFNAVVEQWVRGGVPVEDSEPAKTSPISSSAKDRIFPPKFRPKLVDPTQTISTTVPTEEKIETETGAPDQLLPSIVEGTRAWTGAEEPSGLDWLSMVADMDSKSWDDFMVTCLDSTLQQPLK